MSQYKAFLFDLNGTMVNDMDYHIKAWHTIVNELGANISMEKMKQECYGKNSEVVERILPGRFTEQERHAMGMEKEKKYQHDFLPHLKLINGLHDFLELAHKKKIKMAIGSAAIIGNVNFVIDNLHMRDYFSALISADDVIRSKPDPETFLKCADALKIAPTNCLVFEDAPKGVECARNAGMQTVVLTIMHKKEDFKSYSNIISFIDDYTDESLKEIYNNY